MPSRPIYLDHHATTPTDPRVVAAMLPFFHESFGNAASVGHRYGWEAADALDRAREQVAELLGADPAEVIFTSGATESNNLAIKGALPGLRARGDHLVTSAVEHKSVLDPLKRASRDGWRLTVVEPDAQGLVSEEAVAAALSDRTVLVSVMAANHEIGTRNPIDAIAGLCGKRGILFHTDATQAVGKVPLNLRETRADLLSLSGHKIYGPKGIGALFVRRGGSVSPRLSPLMDGGGQERGLRSGTVAVPLAVGLGAACAIALAEREEDATRSLALRDRLLRGISEGLDGVHRNGHPTLGLPGNLNLSFEGVEGEALMMAMTRVAVSSGSACTSANPEPSHVLRAIGRDEDLARASLRFGLGRGTTAAEIDEAVTFVIETVRRLRARSGRRRLGETERLGFDDAV
ncbi:MAG: cysteine desulfurase family protein [Isosphaeraceae bacterium]